MKDAVTVHDIGTVDPAEVCTNWIKPTTDSFFCNLKKETKQKLHFRHLI